MGCSRDNNQPHSDKNSHDFMLRHEVSWSGNEPYAFGRIFLGSTLQAVAHASAAVAVGAITNVRD